MKRWVRGMRDAFSDTLFALAKKDKDVILVTADTGAICHDEFKRRLKDQYINVGIAEQNMIGVAAGLAMCGKKVFTYAIVPFATMRCYEQIRVDLCCMGLAVTIVGVGAGFDYSTLGPTHHGTEDIAVMLALPGITIYSPSDSIMADALARASYRQRGPKYIRLDRTGRPLIYSSAKEIDIPQGFSVLRRGSDATIIATGRMVHSALEAAQRLSREHISTGVIDLFRVRPVNEERLLAALSQSSCVVTLQEHFSAGGIGSVISEMLIRSRSRARFKGIGIPHEFCRRYGTREYLQCINHIDVKSITRDIKGLFGPSRAHRH